MEEYAAENDLAYDLVLRFRPDVLLFQDFPWNEALHYPPRTVGVARNAELLRQGVETEHRDDFFVIGRQADVLTWTSLYFLLPLCVKYLDSFSRVDTPSCQLRVLKEHRNLSMTVPEGWMSEFDGDYFQTEDGVRPSKYYILRDRRLRARPIHSDAAGPVRLGNTCPPRTASLFLVDGVCNSTLGYKCKVAF